MAFEQRHRVARATKLSSVSDIQIPEDVGNLDQLTREACQATPLVPAACSHMQFQTANCVYQISV